MCNSDVTRSNIDAETYLLLDWFLVTWERHLSESKCIRRHGFTLMDLSPSFPDCIVLHIIIICGTLSSESDPGTTAAFPLILYL